MSKNSKILIVGTTPDYIDIIIKKFNDSVIFLTDINTRKSHPEYHINTKQEIVSDLKDYHSSIKHLKCFINENRINLAGIACFDCESMMLTSKVAGEFGLFYQTEEAIHISRNKFLCKEKWFSAGLHTPSFTLLRSISDATQFFSSIDGSCVLKPLSGAGSELVFRCDSENDLKTRFTQIEQSLYKKKANPLYNFSYLNNTPLILAEECIDGDEYSCDFIYDGKNTQILRLTKKLKIPEMPFGIIAGYEILNSIPGFSHTNLEQTLSSAAKAAGIINAITMIDFFIKDSKLFLIEIAPRPGGDCLPHLFFHASEMDMLELNIKHCAGLISLFPDYRELKQLIAFRFFSPKNGKLLSIDVSDLKNDENVMSIQITAQCGAYIKLPPEDYDSWILGSYIIRQNTKKSDLKILFSKLSKKVKTVLVH